jgi:hypothetical protein
MENCRENVQVLKEGLENTGRFNIVSKDNILCNLSHVEYNNIYYIVSITKTLATMVQQQSNNKSTLKLLKASQFTPLLEHRHCPLAPSSFR